jgi:hypothetical protein
MGLQGADNMLSSSIRALKSEKFLLSRLGSQPAQPRLPYGPAVHAQLIKPGQQKKNMLSGPLAGSTDPRPNYTRGLFFGFGLYGNWLAA